MHIFGGGVSLDENEKVYFLQAVPGRFLKGQNIIYPILTMKIEEVCIEIFIFSTY